MAFEAGHPCWADLSTPDLEASKAFYSGLFGWEPQTSAIGYTMFNLGDRHIAAAMPQESPAFPTAWTTYINVVDAESTAKAIQDAGGQILMAPMDVVDQGRIALFADAQGAVLGLWQPLAFQGAGLIREPNTYCWSEVACRDVEAAKTFYNEVFGWSGDTHVFGTSSYTEWDTGGRPFAGMVEMNEVWPPEVPAHWMVYFAVDDCDAAASKAAALGGLVSVPPHGIPSGRFAVLNDPQGAVFSVIRLAE